MKRVHDSDKAAPTILAVLAIVAFVATPLLGQDSPTGEDPVVAPAATHIPTPTPSPTPLPTATPTPTGNPTPEPPTEAAPATKPTSTPTPDAAKEVASEPIETPLPADESAPSEENPVPDNNEPPDDQTAAASDDGVAKKDKEINPGDTAFTDYAPFDLDQIEPEPMRSKWGNFVAAVRGLSRYTLFDGKVKFRLGASLKVDGTTGSGTEAYEDAYGPIDTDLDFRLGVVYAVGRIQNFNFSVGFDFGADPGIDSAWIEGAKGGLEVWGKYLGKLRIGFVGEPFSFERQASSYNATFLERSLPVQTIAPGYNAGVLVHDSGRKGRTSWAVGIFSLGSTNEGNASSSLLSLTGRFTYLPVYRDEGQRLFHVGLAGSSRSPSGGDMQYRSRPEARFVDFLADTGSFSAGNTTLLGAEAATVNGPLWAAAEYIHSNVSADSVGDPSFHGGYVQVGYFLTGEHRPYKTDSGTFGRVLPKTRYSGGSPFKKVGGGAWEVAGRISYIDLNAGLIQGGKITDISAALSWYTDPTTRIALNFIHTKPGDRGSANIILLRLQYNPW